LSALYNLLAAIFHTSVLNVVLILVRKGGIKTRDWKTRYRTTGLENATLERRDRTAGLENERTGWLWKADQA